MDTRLYMTFTASFGYSRGDTRTPRASSGRLHSHIGEILSVIAMQGFPGWRLCALKAREHCPIMRRFWNPVEAHSQLRRPTQLWRRAMHLCIALSGPSIDASWILLTLCI